MSPSLGTSSGGFRLPGNTDRLSGRAMLHLPSDVSTQHGEVRAKRHRSDPLDQRISAALIEERQLGGRLGAHALACAFSAIAGWCALVHPWPGAAFYLGLVAAFLCLAWVWGRLARRPL